MINKDAYDNLCDKLEPYVALTVPLPSEKELADLIAKNAADKATLKKTLREEEQDQATRNALEDELSPLFDYTPNPESLRLTRIKVATEVIVNSWSEALRKVYKERGEIKLRDCLLPDGFEDASWKSSLNRFSLGQEQMEDLLQIFGQKEILPGSIELPWGGYVKRAGDKYELCGP